MPSISEVDTFLLQAKEVDGKIKWKRKDNGYFWWQAVLIGEDGIVIPQARIVLTTNPDEVLYKFSFGLLYRGYNVRRLDIDDTHVRTNPRSCPEYGGEKIMGNHVHIWNPDNADNCVVPVAIMARDKTYEQWFDYFLKLANLVYNGIYIPPPLIRTEPRLL